MSLWHNISELTDYYIPPMPPIYWIDTIRLCNLKCIMCPQSRGLSERPAKMAMDVFRGIIDDVCGNHPSIKLYLSGEPLLHENLFEMIEYAHAKGCRTVVHTNATRLTKDLSEKILASPLTFLSFSFDGCSPQVYERLRPPASFDEVRSNIRTYLDLRQAGGGRGPHTSIEIIRMRDTEGFLEQFADQWQVRGVDEVRIVDYVTWLDCVVDRRVSPVSGDDGYKPCAAPFRHGCILSDGTVVPCCMDVDGRMPMGNVADQPFHEIWVGNTYRHLRLQMLTGDLAAGSFCHGCENTSRKSEPAGL